MNDTTGQPGGSVGASTNVATNDQFPAGSSFTFVPGASTCTAATVSTAGVATYNVPATGSCTVNYQVCAPAPNATVCDTATLSVTASASDMSAALGATTPAVVSPGQVLSGLTATCTNVGATAATNPTCVPTVSAGTISALNCVPASPASLAAGSAIVCTYTYTAPGTAGGTDEPTTNVTFTATTGAANDSNAANNVATQAATVIDAVNDVDTKQPNVAVTTNLASNDQFPAGSVFTLQPGSTCLSPAVSAVGSASYTSPTVATATCTVNYRVCAPAPNGAVCDTATLTVTAGAAPLLTVTKTASQSPLVAAQAGQFYTITITVTNGPTTAAITLSDAMPVGVTTSGSVTATGGTLSGCPGIGATNLTGCTIAPSTAGLIVITVPVAVGPTAPNTLVNSATVTGGGDPSCPAAEHCTGTVTTVLTRPDMQVVPRTELPPAIKDVPYPTGQTIICTNASSVPATNATCSVTDLPPGLISTCTPTSPVASLAPGGTIVCTISGTPTTTKQINAKVTTGADGDTVATNNEGIIVSKLLPGLNVTKTVSVNPLIIGATDQYYSISIAVTNGPTTAPIVLNDNFSAGITSSAPVTISGGTFIASTCSAATQAGATSLTGCSIEAGVTGTIYIKVPILVSGAAEGETGGNNTVIASGGGDLSCPDSANCIGSTGAVSVIYGDLGSLFIRKVADKATVEIGDALTYQIAVKSSKVTGTATIVDHLPLGFKLISNTVRVTKAGVLVAAPDPAGAPGPNLTFKVQIPAIDQEIVIEYKVRVGLGADRGDGINQAQASMLNGRLKSMVAKAKVKVTGGVFTREACIIGKVYADCNGNAVQDKGEPAIPGVALFLEDGTSMTTDENGQYSICGVRAITHVLKIDSKTLPTGSVLGITSNRNAGDPNSLFVDVLAGQLHNTEFRVEGCSPQMQEQIQMRQKGQTTQAPGSTERSIKGGVQFDSSQPNINGGGSFRPGSKAVEAGSK